ncbi:alpha/beta-hydrolase [Fistulina hepatica ATCC 64428]|uniref:Carboxylic ester hydrolase n=1 Tax=Fistulina hepatica ATCC 64428 TaxID=1128425 RepID=A0A0D7AKR6_9AGAR|nr:alpha/beta-hydrolase [Fistulina hepatica ATCC 64428]
MAAVVALFSFLHVVASLTIPNDHEPLRQRSTPTVTLDNATVTGYNSGSISYYLAELSSRRSRTGDLRFRLPESIDGYSEDFDATSYSPACAQQSVSVPLPSGIISEVTDYIVDTLYADVFPDSEDCKSLSQRGRARDGNRNVESARPSSNSRKWIFGGGFEFGDPSLYDGGIIVQRSIDLGIPLIYVSINYRLSTFGFLASQEVMDAGVGNLGLQDQRESFRWVQNYISAFGGDPDKVTIWGQSAGAISVALQMLTNDGDTEGLFRAAFMQSGAPIPVGNITQGQKYYDQIVEETGCSGASDTLECLRGVSYDTLVDAMNNSPFFFAYQSLDLAWVPRVDGVFLTDLPTQLVADGVIADIPFINGDNDDEGTLFSLSTLNITTDDEFCDWVQEYFLPNATEDQLDELLELYPSTLADGSPYNTSDLDTLSTQYKRIASFQGDAVFQSVRRYFLQHTADKQNVWSYLNKRLKLVPYLGSFHGSDLLQVYGDEELTDYLVRFAVNLDPNGDTGIEWPQYTTASPQMLMMQDDLFEPLTTTEDTYRKAPMAYLNELALTNPL